ncbi:MAG: DJ-1/PfpI family protein, partial [Candidatus Eremiobacteraeota bacterium]|nr:DJ-1/PfpI family protein [Candidatus Eremiobacteraeota bacterium]
GTSPDHIRTDRHVHRFVREFDAVKKPMFSIGHGAQVLISSQLVRGRQITGAPSIADDIRNAGGLYRDQPTVTDSNWVSTRGGDDIAQFNRAMLEKLATSTPAQPLA